MAVALRSMIPVWLIAVVGVLLVGLYTGVRYLEWLPVVMALAILVSFVIQLAVGRTDGLVSRLAGSLVGSLIVVALATGILVLVEPAGLGFAA